MDKITNNSQDIYDLICIGGGAAGFFGAISCAELAAKPVKIAIVEATNRPLTKVKISGGGRCNVTHHCFAPKTLVQNYPRGGKDLLNGFFKFGPQEMIAWLEQREIKVVPEKDGRMFPHTNRSQTILDCFLSEVERLDIKLLKGKIVRSITKEQDIFHLSTKDQTIQSKKLLLATGGMPQGHKLAEQLGHTITELAPSLFTLKSTHPIIADMAGISVEKAEVCLQVGQKKFKQTGPVLITHWGFSGPAILKLSAFAAREFLSNNYEGQLIINWLPKQNNEELWNKLKGYRDSDPKKKLSKTKVVDLANRLWQRLLELVHLQENTWADTSDASLKNLLEALTQGSYDFSGKGEFKEEFVTCGGVSLKEVNLKTFESSVCGGLYLAGEILDVDGITGGFNFQNAWTSSRLAATDVAKKITEN